MTFMKKITLLAATALISLAANAQTVVGLERPLNEDGTFAAYTSTDDYLKSADGLTVKFYESEAIAETRTTANQYGLIYHGNSMKSDFAWNLQCNSTGYMGALDHGADAKFPEGYTFGFDVTVPDGKLFAVSGVTLDLLFNANHTWRIRIADADGKELYNSGCMDKYGALRGYLSCGGYAHVTDSKLSMEYAADPNMGLNADNATAKAEEAIEAGFQLLPKELTLAAGTYTVMLDFDFANSTKKQLSFASFTIEGQIESGEGPIAIPTTWNFSEWEKGSFTETFTKNGLTVACATGMNVDIDGNNKTVDGVKYTQRLKLGDTGDESSRHLSFVTPGKCTIELVLCSANSDEERTLNIAVDAFSNVVSTMTAPANAPVKSAWSYDGDQTTVYLYSAKSGINIYAIYIKEYDETVGISSVGQVKRVDTAVYNLAGQHVAAPMSKQIYIQDGKKFVVR